MQKWEKALLQMAVVSGLLFALLIATEVRMLPSNARGDGVLFRWQVWLLGCLVLIATRDLVSQVRCRCCGSREQISPLRLLPFREVLCRSCLTWDQRIAPAEAHGLSAEPTAFSAVPDALKPYWMRRPNKTWLPSLWVSTSRMYVLRWAGLRKEKQA